MSAMSRYLRFLKRFLKRFWRNEVFNGCNSQQLHAVRQLIEYQEKFDDF